MQIQKVTGPFPGLANLKRIQRRVAEAFPRGNVYVAGGACRDAYLGFDRKDVDVFVESRRDLGGFEATREKLDAVLGKPVRGLSHVEYLNWQPEVTGFANWDLFGEDVQVVGVDYRPLTLYNLLKRFDVALAQAGLDEAGNLCVTDQFLRDVTNKTYTVVRCISPHDAKRTMERWRRHREKFPGLEINWNGVPREWLDYAAGIRPLTSCGGTQYTGPDGVTWWYSEFDMEKDTCLSR